MIAERGGDVANIAETARNVRAEPRPIAHEAAASRLFRVIEREVGMLAHALGDRVAERSEEHTSELQSLMRISYAVFLLAHHTNETNDRYSITPLTLH